MLHLLPLDDRVLRCTAGRGPQQQHVSSPLPFAACLWTSVLQAIRVLLQENSPVFPWTDMSFVLFFKDQAIRPVNLRVCAIALSGWICSSFLY